jgi:hypothetical protein
VGAHPRDPHAEQLTRDPTERVGRLRILRALAVDTGPLRHSRDYRLLALGGFVSGLGTQITLVALPYQVFVLTRSSFAVGLIGLAELVPLVALSLIGGTLADRTERRRLLMVAQVVQLSTSALLALGAAFGLPWPACTCSPGSRRRRPPSTAPPATRSCPRSWRATSCGPRSRSTTGSPS